MANKVFLFTGEERFLLQQELKRWTDNFAQKYGAENVFVIRSDAFDLGVIKQTLGGGGLFSSQKLLIIYGVPSDGAPDNKVPSASVELFGDLCISADLQFSPETLVVLVSYKPDKRTKFYKYLEKNATVKSFEKPKNLWEMKSYLKPYVLEWTPGLTWSDATMTYFLEKVGTDLYHIQLECDKLLVYARLYNLTQLESKHIDLLSFGVLDTNSFAFFDLLLVDKLKALRIVEDSQEQGIHWTMFAGSLYWGLKLWIFVLDLDAQGITDSKIISSMTKLSPFAVSKALKLLPNLRKSSSSITAFYRMLVDLDEGIKTGKVSEVLFWISIKKNILESF
ncbi:MAG: hypothetical protein WCO66_03015 [Candidatus Absconditabacteria bacterium]